QAKNYYCSFFWISYIFDHVSSVYYRGNAFGFAGSAAVFHFLCGWMAIRGAVSDSADGLSILYWRAHNGPWHSPIDPAADHHRKSVSQPETEGSFYRASRR